ncbi:MAG: AraC family transcriptional regulator [Zavarzinia sp.]|nr:AraC family transcriptional regulator [Zavarzinia sp.]
MGSALAFADRSEAEPGLQALLEGRKGAGGTGDGAGTGGGSVHPFGLDGLAGFVVRMAEAVVVECQPPHYVLLLPVEGTARVGTINAGPEHVFILVPRKTCRISLGAGCLAILCLVSAEAMANLSRMALTSGREAFRAEGILQLSLDEGAPRLLPGLAMLLLAALGIDRVSAEVPSSPLSPSVPRHVKRAEDYLARHMREPLTMVELAERVGASPRSLNRAFLRFRGMTPSRCLQNLRVEAAHRLLSSDACALDLREVAAEVGFGSYAPFWRAYVRRFGQPPSLGRRRGKDTAS